MLVRLVLLISLVVGGAGPSADAADPSVVYLDRLASPDGWRVTGGAIRRSREIQADGRPTLHVRVPIEAAGAADESVDWPKLWHALSSDSEVAWEGFDRFEFLVMARLDPPVVAPPKKIAIQLLAPDKEHATTTSAQFDQLDTWVRVSIPIAEIRDLSQLEAIQLYLAKRWYRGIGMAEFFLGGFRLVRDEATSAPRFTLLTPLPSLSRPILRIDAAHHHATTPFRMESGRHMLAEGSADVTPAGEILIDLVELRLPAGRHRLTLFPDDPSARQMLSFDWLPLDLVRARFGTLAAGENLVEVEVVNSSAREEEIEIDLRWEGARVATRRLTAPAGATVATQLSLPLRVNQSGVARIVALRGDRVIGMAEQQVEAPDPLGEVPRHIAAAFRPATPIELGIPVLLGEGSWEGARLHWELRSPSGDAAARGEAALDGPRAGISVPAPAADEAGPHTLLTRLRWAAGEASAETSLFLVLSPFGP